LKEKLSSKKIICIGFAMLGMIFIVGSNKTSQPGYHHLLGIADGLIAASFYATLMLLNKFIKNMDGLKTTLIQLSMATFLLIPYVVITSPIKSEQFTNYSIFLILIVGILHTGIAFFLFFTGMNGLKGQSIAILSYIDPITSLLLSFFILQERMTLLQVTGAIMLLGATLLSESKVK
jgi:drug/metabolite transporter (DMT)-like permease